MSAVRSIPVGEPGDGIVDVAAPDDGAVWLTLTERGRVMRREADGTMTVLDLGAGARPAGVAAATETGVWVVDRTGDRLLHLGFAPRAVREIAVLGEIHVPTPGAFPLGVVGLPDGTAWFTEPFAGALGRIDILGRVEEFPAGAGPAEIATSGDSLWFTLQGVPAIGHVRGGDAAVALTALPEGSAPFGVTVADDGTVWAALHGGDALARLDRHGELTLVPLPAGSEPYGVVAAPSGVWATLSGADALAHVDAEGAVTIHPLPEGAVRPRGVTVDARGRVWAGAEGHLLVVEPTG